VGPDILTDDGAFIYSQLSGGQEHFWDCLTLEGEGTDILQTLGITHPTVLHHMPEDLNPGRDMYFTFFTIMALCDDHFICKAFAMQ
jgi:hypothetical protein